MTKDRIFHTKQSTIRPFEFNTEVANVFDDMVSRSIPFYHEIHRLILDLVGRTELPTGPIWDLGCSTGTTIYTLDQFFKNFPEKRRPMIGVDSSNPMLEKAQEKLQGHQVENYQLKCADINDLQLSESSVIIMNYTLQFLTPEGRENLLQRIYNSLKPGGIFFLAEKITTDNNHFQELFTDLYYDFKRRNGYSEMEISQKREALENVLIPNSPKELFDKLKEAGFDNTEMVFRFYNFACFMGVKN